MVFWFFVLRMKSNYINNLSNSEIIKKSTTGSAVSLIIDMRLRILLNYHCGRLGSVRSAMIKPLHVYKHCVRCGSKVDAESSDDEGRSVELLLCANAQQKTNGTCGDFSAYNSYWFFFDLRTFHFFWYLIISQILI